MKLKISKIDASTSQLKEAVRLHFEERDPVSIHTLACASNEVLNDYLKSKGLPTFIHKGSSLIRPEKQKEWALKLTEARNFFKHADKHIIQGIEEIEFQPEINAFIILDSILALERLEYKNYLKAGEFLVFCVWFALKFPDSFSPEYVERARTLDMNPNDLSEFYKLLNDFEQLLPSLLKTGFWAD